MNSREIDAHRAIYAGLVKAKLQVLEDIAAEGTDKQVAARARKFLSVYRVLAKADER